MSSSSRPKANDDDQVARSYLGYLRELLDSIDLGQIERIVDALRAARARGASVYVVGNGGSASTASHFATDLGKLPARPGLKPMRVGSLTDNAAWITALGNDHGFENVFAGQLDGLLKSGDVLVAISASGNSPNVLRAVELAKKRAAVTVGIVGFDGGELLRMVDLPLFVRSVPGRYGPVEDAHLAAHHIITACLAEA